MFFFKKEETIKNPQSDEQVQKASVVQKLPPP